MLKNKDVRKLILKLLLIISFFLCISFIGSKAICEDYYQGIINSNAYIINSLIVKHPELESEIIDAVIHNNGTAYGSQLLQKYGVDAETITYQGNYAALKKNLFLYHIGLLLLALVIVVAFVLFYLYRHYQKIRLIGEYMDRILNDDYSIDIREYDEGDLSNLKNDIYKVTVKMKENSDQLLRDKKYLEETLSDISHQLKTPLTSMYLMNDILETEKSAKVRKQFLDKNRLQLERIEWLVTSLLKISRLDSGTVKLKEECVSAKDLIKHAINPISLMMEQKNIELTLDVDDFSFVVDFNWTVEALVNIIKNAAEHTQAGGSISIAAKDNPLYSEILISDTGEGISKKDLPHIFERFYKGSSHNKESIGIGLNMAKKIISLENGDIEVTSTLGKGTTFDIKFYKKII